MDQTSGAVKPTGTGVELRLLARVRSKKTYTENSSTNVISPQRIVLDIIIVSERFDSADVRA